MQSRAENLLLQLSDIPFISSTEDTLRIPCDESAASHYCAMFSRIFSDSGTPNMHPRFLQREILETAILRTDAVCVMPTGGGKSEAIFCSGLAAPSCPAGLRSITVVVTPLLELGSEFAKRLNLYRPGCAIFTSATSAGTGYSEFMQLAKGYIQDSFTAEDSTLPPAPGTLEAEILADNSSVIFVVTTAEKLSASNKFVRALVALQDRGRLWQFVVDEAHVVGVWGHFRPAYTHLGTVFDVIAAGSVGSTPQPRPRRLALSGTLNIAQSLQCASSLRMLASASIFRVSVDRPNIMIHVLDLGDVRGSKSAVMKEALTRLFPIIASARRILIFVDTKSDVRLISKSCRQRGFLTFVSFRANTTEEAAEVAGQRDAWSAAPYHPGELPPVCVGTSYIGLGLNDTIVDMVISLCHRPTVQQLWQEAGRVGRSGQPSRAIFVRHPILLDSVCWSVKMTDGEGGRALLHQSIVALSSVSLGCRRALILSALGDDGIMGTCDACDMCRSACNAVPVTIRFENLTNQARALLRIVADSPSPISFRYSDLLTGDAKQLWRSSLTTEQANSLVYFLLEIKALRLGSSATGSPMSKFDYTTVSVVEENAAEFISGQKHAVVPVVNHVLPVAFPPPSDIRAVAPASGRAE